MTVAIIIAVQQPGCLLFAVCCLLNTLHIVRSNIATPPTSSSRNRPPPWQQDLLAMLRVGIDEPPR